MAAHRRKLPKRYYSKTRTKPAKKTVFRRILLILLLLALTIALLFGLGAGLKYAGSFFFSRNSRFELKTINISSDGRLTPDFFRSLSGLEPGVNLFAINFDDIRTRLEKEPLVESVIISRQLPDTLTIQVVERIPRAQIKWSRRARPFLIDFSGMVMPSPPNETSLPLIRGLKLDGLRPGTRLNQPSIRQSLDILMAVDELGLGSQVTFNSFDLRYPDFITAVVNGDVSVRFPQHSAREKLRKLVATLQSATVRGTRVKTIDLTPDGRNVVVVEE